MPKHEIRDFVDVLLAQSATKRFAATLGFSARECSELAIVASELCSNIVKYGVSGSIELLATSDSRGMGIQLIARDIKPPLRNLQQAMQDGWDDTGPIDPLLLVKRNGLGGGLGAVLRLTDGVSMEAEPGGKRIQAVRYLRGL